MKWNKRGLLPSRRQGWFPASYVAPVEDLGASFRNHSMNNLLEPTSQSESVDSRNYGEIPTPAPPLPRSSNDLRTVSPLLDRKVESVYEAKVSQSYSEIPSPAPPVRRASGDFRPVSPLLDRRAESHFESMTGYSIPERKAELNVEVCASLAICRGFFSLRFWPLGFIEAQI